jgi:deoxyxylulose-5-phosphate synthase
VEGKILESRGDALESLQDRVEPYARRPMRSQKKRSPHSWVKPGRQSGEAGEDVGSREAQGVEGIGRCTRGAIIGGCSLRGGSAVEATELDDV